MSESNSGGSPKHDEVRDDTKEDAETRAARRELKQSSISDPSPNEDGPASTPDDTTTGQGEDGLKEKVSSPKKKRAHDQLDTTREKADKEASEDDESSKDRTERLEPEKKRARDEEDTKQAADKSESHESKTEQTKPAPSGFEASAFGKLASGSSPFTTLGGTGGSGFAAAGKGGLTSFASGAKATSTTESTSQSSFGGNSGASPFGGLPKSSNGFGSALGGSAFSSLGSAKPLGSFASSATSKPFSTTKASKPFGAPDSDAEASDNEDDENENEGDEKKNNEDEDNGESSDRDEDRKKTKLHKVDIDDGESGDVTLISVRSKMFVHEADAGWKERGAGMVKINVPHSCVEFDDNGNVQPGSFDASGLEDDSDEQTKVARLIMRQDQTHRVILNTPILPVMKFQEKSTLKSASATSILFTAFDGPEAKPISVTIRMNNTNAKLFMSEVASIQRELQDR